MILCCRNHQTLICIVVIILFILLGNFHLHQFLQNGFSIVRTAMQAPRWESRLCRGRFCGHPDLWNSIHRWFPIHQALKLACISLECLLLELSDWSLDCSVFVLLVPVWDTNWVFLFVGYEFSALREWQAVTGRRYGGRDVTDSSAAASNSCRIFTKPQKERQWQAVTRISCPPHHDVRENARHHTPINPYNRAN